MFNKVEPLLDDDGFPMARMAELKGELHVSFPIGYRNYMKACEIRDWLIAATKPGYAEAKCDRAYYDGAKQAAIIANRSLEALDEWIRGGCGGRLEQSRAMLAASPKVAPLAEDKGT